VATRVPAQGSGPARPLAYNDLPCGIRHDRIAAPCVIDAPINGESFLAYVEQVRVPTLQPGDIVVMDNLGSHKGARSAGLSAPSMHGSSSCHLTAPTSIRSSKSFAKPKILLRMAKERTIEGVWRRNRHSAPALHTTGMRQLSAQRRLCSNLNQKDSSP
jgi:hypothetical protein